MVLLQEAAVTTTTVASTCPVTRPVFSLQPKVPVLLEEGQVQSQFFPRPPRIYSGLELAALPHTVLQPGTDVGWPMPSFHPGQLGPGLWLGTFSHHSLALTGLFTLVILWLFSVVCFSTCVSHVGWEPCCQVRLDLSPSLFLVLPPLPCPPSLPLFSELWF